MTAATTAEIPLPRAGKPDSIYGRRYLAVTVGIIASVLLTAFEGLAVFTALPVAVDAVHGTAYLSLMFTAYTTTSLVGMVLSGVAADRGGPRASFLGGITVFGAGLLIAGTATTMTQLVGGRAVQGFGAGLVMVALYVVVGRAYPDALRAKAFALMAALWVLPSVVGPLVAGTLTEHLSWRWVFLGVAALVPVPIAVLAGPLGRMAGPAESRGGAGGSGTPNPGSDVAAAGEPAVPASVARIMTPRARVTAAVLSALGAGLLQFAGQDPTPVAGVLVVVALALLIPSAPKLMPVGMLRARRGLPSVILLHGILSGAFFGSENYISALLENERGVSPTVAGLTLTGVTFSWAATAALTSRDRIPMSRETMVGTGAVITVGSIAVTGSAVWLPLPAAVVTLGMVIGGAGMGLAFPSLNILLLRLSPPAEHGVNSASMQIVDCFGAVLVTGSTGAVFHALHRADGGNRGVFLLMFAMMAATAVAAAVIAPRVRAAGQASRFSNSTSATANSTAT